MIKATELRIGNLFEVYDNLFNRVDAISEEKIRFKNNKGTFYVDPKDINPIPLTPEILERFGFKKDKRDYSNQSYSNEGIIIEEVNGGFELFASEWTIGETFYFLHELQNICLGLFKFELVIKELQPT